MRYKVLLHLAASFILIASAKIILQRAIIEGSGSGLLSCHNVPLGAAVLITIILLESFGRKLPRFLSLGAFLFSIVFLLSSFYLPPKGHSADVSFVLSYASLITLLSVAVGAWIFRAPDLKRTVVLVFAFSLSGFIAGFLYTYSNNHAFHGKPVADVAVVLGGAVWGPHTPSPDLRARLDAAAKLYKSGEAREIAVTGGTRRFNTFESEIGAWYLREKGIPASAIITEHRTFNTFEQVVYVKRYLVDKLKMKNVVIVSDNWHLPRALLMCNWVNLEATGYASHYYMSVEAAMYWRIREAAGLQVYTLFGA